MSEQFRAINAQPDNSPPIIRGVDGGLVVPFRRDPSHYLYGRDEPGCLSLPSVLVDEPRPNNELSGPESINVKPTAHTTRRHTDIVEQSSIANNDKFRKFKSGVAAGS